MKEKFKVYSLKSKVGFTLIELLTVVFIIGVLVAIGIPVWRNIQPTLELSGSSRELITNLRYAQQLAITEQIIYGVRFDFEENQYQIIQYKKTNGETEEIIKSKLLSEEGITLEQIDNFSEAKFTPYGSVIQGGNVRLINTKNQTKTIDIRPSGFVRTVD